MGFDLLVALATLTALEIVLGIDNIVFIAIIAGKLPAGQQNKARAIGLFLAMGTRIVLLLLIVWLTHLTKPLFSLLNHTFSARDLILLAGGLFLVAKATYEIHQHTEGHHESSKSVDKKSISFRAVIAQIVLIDIVFSLDSVITAVGMVQNITVMIAAIIIAILVMLLFSRAISDFVARHPTIKTLALSFLLLIGVMLIVESFGGHIERGYVYFAMAFSLLVEILNLRLARS